MLKNLTIRDRILTGYAVPTILIMVFGSLVYLTANQISETFKQVNVSQNAIIATSEMMVSLTRMNLRIRRYLLSKNSEALDNFKKDKRRFDDASERAEKVIKNPESKEKFIKMLKLAEQFEYLATRTVSLENEGKHNEAVDLNLKNTKTLVDEFDRLNEEFNKLQLEIIAKDTEATKTSVNYLILASVLISMGCLAIAIGAAYLITQPLGMRIAGVVKVAEQISEGDLTQSLEVTSNNQDEIGKLLDTFRTMSQNLNSLIRQVQQSGIQVTTSATQIAASGKQLEATTTEQVASTNQVMATAKEIATNSEELVKTMDEVAAMAIATTTAAGGGQKDLVLMEATMRQLADATSSISNKLGAISEKANNINSIVTTITKVADQTNLLSLNAAIEAEKAGEYGLGFAVVAREIRRLADQTAVATLDIEQMVKEMQSAVSTGVMEMDKFTKEVAGSIDSVRNISLQIAQIIEQVQSLAPRFEAVNQGMEAQSQGAGQISDAMIQLSETSSQTANALREINRAIEQLNEAAHGLQREISRFKVQN